MKYRIKIRRITKSIEKDWWQTKAIDSTTIDGMGKTKELSVWAFDECLKLHIENCQRKGNISCLSHSAESVWFRLYNKTRDGHAFTYIKGNDYLPTWDEDLCPDTEVKIYCVEFEIKEGVKYD